MENNTEVTIQRLKDDENLFRSELIYKDTYNDRLFDVYYVSCFSMEEAFAVENGYDFSYRLMERIQSYNPSCGMFFLSRGAFAAEHCDENSSGFMLCYGGKEYPVMKKTMCCTDCSDGFSCTVKAKAVSVADRVLMFKQHSSFFSPLFFGNCDDNCTFDIYVNKGGHPQAVHNELGGNCVKDFANALADAVREVNAAERIYDAGTFAFAVKHREKNISGFIFDYGNIRNEIFKKTIRFENV